jgi:hypothetical protein
MVGKIKKTIGRREKISFPDLGLFNIEAKVDTGAYTTALHCHDILMDTTFEKPVLLFKLLDPSHPEYNEQEHRFTDFSKKEIKNSFGDLEERYIIKTKVKIGNKTINTLISLTDRGNMRYPVLIGRKLLKNRFIVDISEIYLTEKKIKK